MFIDRDAASVPSAADRGDLETGASGGGCVYLVGAGPGDPDLLTVKAARMIARADAVVYDRLVSPEVLEMVPPSAKMVPVGKSPRSHPVPQDRINRILVDLARAGLRVVRLKGGDPLIFGRGSEEAEMLTEAGIPVEVVPGITAAQGSSAAAGVPLTHRGVATGVRYLTGQCRAGVPLDADWAGLADPDTTLVVYMGLARIGWIASQLMDHGSSPSTPVLAVSNATTPRERRAVSTLAEISDEAHAAALTPPTLFIIGKVVALARSETLVREAANTAVRAVERINA